MSPSDLTPEAPLEPLPRSLASTRGCVPSHLCSPPSQNSISKPDRLVLEGLPHSPPGAAHGSPFMVQQVAAPCGRTDGEGLGPPCLPREGWHRGLCTP